MRFNSHVRLYTAGLAVAAILAIPSAAQTRERRTAADASAVSRIRIDNFGQVDRAYFRGAQPQGRDYQDLAALGVKTIIDLTEDGGSTNEKALTERGGMRYVQIAMTTHRAPTAAQLSEFLRIVNDPASQPVFVHCAGGRHRTGVMTAVYRMSHDGWQADQAFAEMKRYRFGLDFLHPEFKAFVYGYRPAVAEAAARRSPLRRRGPADRINANA